MSKAAYPDGADLSSYLQAMDLDVDGLDLDTVMSAGIKHFEQKANRKLLAGASAQRNYDVPTMRNGILNIEDLAVLSSVVYQPAASQSTTFVLGTDFWTLPMNAGALGSPITQLRFWIRWAAPISPFLRNALQVTGQWGFGTALQEDVWLALVQQAGILLMPQLVQRVTQGATAIEKPGPNRVVFGERQGVAPLQALRDYWQRNINEALANVRRVEIG